MIDSRRVSDLNPSNPTCNLTIVVACQKSSGNVFESLQAIEDQRSEAVGQVILVHNSDNVLTCKVRARFPNVDVILAPAHELTPRLWGRGILRSSGDRIALTTSEMIPEPGWASALLAAHDTGGWTAVGGPIVMWPRLRPYEQAVYWLRYSGFARPSSGDVYNLAGDNASYRRADLDPYMELIRQEGFWESEIHVLLRKRGARLLLIQDAGVRFRGGISFAIFAHQRRIHGRRFGWKRASGKSQLQVMLLVAGWPILSLGFLARICRNAALAHGMRSLITSMPALLWFLASWSVGELEGFLGIGSSGP